jgi:hypothetical protein
MKTIKRQYIFHAHSKVTVKTKKNNMFLEDEVNSDINLVKYRVLGLRIKHKIVSNSKDTNTKAIPRFELCTEKRHVEPSFSNNKGKSRTQKPTQFLLFFHLKPPASPSSSSPRSPTKVRALA